MRFAVWLILWIAAVFALMLAIMLGSLGLLGPGAWSGLRLFIRLVYVADLLICAAMVFVAVRTADNRRRLATLVAAAGTAPAVLSFAQWANR